MVAVATRQGRGFSAAGSSSPRSAAGAGLDPSALQQSRRARIGRTVEIDTTGGPGFGFEHFKELDFLRDKEVV